MEIEKSLKKAFKLQQENNIEDVFWIIPNTAENTPVVLSESDFCKKLHEIDKQTIYSRDDLVKEFLKIEKGEIHKQQQGLFQTVINLLNECKSKIDDVLNKLDQIRSENDLQAFIIEAQSENWKGGKKQNRVMEVVKIVQNLKLLSTHNPNFINDNMTAVHQLMQEFNSHLNNFCNNFFQQIHSVKEKVPMLQITTTNGAKDVINNNELNINSSNDIIELTKRDSLQKNNEKETLNQTKISISLSQLKTSLKDASNIVWKISDSNSLIECSKISKESFIEEITQISLSKKISLIGFLICKKPSQKFDIKYKLEEEMSSYQSAFLSTAEEIPLIESYMLLKPIILLANKNYTFKIKCFNNLESILSVPIFPAPQKCQWNDISITFHKSTINSNENPSYGVISALIVDCESQEIKLKQEFKIELSKQNPSSIYEITLIQSQIL